MSNLTTKDNQLQGNQDQKAQTVFMTSCERDTKLSENRVAKVTGSRGNNGAEPMLTSVEEPSVQHRESKIPGHEIKWKITQHQNKIRPDTK